MDPEGRIYRSANVPFAAEARRMGLAALSRPLCSVQFGLLTLPRNSELGESSPQTPSSSSSLGFTEAHRGSRTPSPSEVEPRPEPRCSLLPSRVLILVQERLGGSEPGEIIATRTCASAELGGLQSPKILKGSCEPTKDWSSLSACFHVAERNWNGIESGGDCTHGWMNGWDGGGGALGRGAHAREFPLKDSETVSWETLFLERPPPPPPNPPSTTQPWPSRFLGTSLGLSIRGVRHFRFHRDCRRWRGRTGQGGGVFSTPIGISFHSLRLSPNSSSPSPESGCLPPARPL